MKRSPYFFQRLQAEKRLQTYISTSFFLFLLTIGITTYAWQTPQDQTPRVAILTNSKPVQDIALVENAPEILEDVAAESAETLLESPDSVGSLIQVNSQPFGPSMPELPEAYNRLTPSAELNENSDLSKLIFSTEVTEDYDPVGPQEIFPEGFYRIYATFDYEGLEDGMVWSWVWHHNGDVVEGGHEEWVYGDEGPGYIYFEPDEGFDNGLYTLNVWVNGELLTQSSVIMNSATVTANN